MDRRPNDSGPAGNRFATRVLHLAAGTAFSQALVVLCSPLLTRLYSPEDFGAFTFLYAVVTTIGIVSAGRYEFAIPMASSNQKARTVMKLGMIISASVTIVATAILLGITRFVPDLGSVSDLYILFAFPVAVLALAGQGIFSYWCIRQEKFKQMSLSRCIASIVTVSAQIGLAYITKSAYGLFTGYVLGQAVGAATLAKPTAKDRETTDSDTTKSSLKEVAVEFKNFPIFSATSAGFNLLSSQAAVFFLSAFYGTVATGFYGLAARVLMSPVSILAQSTGQVFFSRAPKAKEDGTLGELTLNVFSRLFSLALPITIVFFQVAPDLFGFVFGSEWREAGHYSRLLAPWSLLVFVSGPLSKLTAVLDRQQSELRFQVYMLVVRAGVLTFACSNGDASFAIAWYGMASAGMWLLYVGWLLSMVGALAQAGKAVLRLAPEGIAAGAPCAIANYLWPQSEIALFVAAGIGVIIGSSLYLWRYHRNWLVRR